MTGRNWAAYRMPALVALSLFIPFANYGFRGDLVGGDAAIAWALPSEQLRQVLGVYVDTHGLGYNGATGLASAFPALTLAAALHALGLGTPLVARLMIALYFFLAMSGALKLFDLLLPNDPAGRGASFIAAVFYGINRYTLLLYFTAQTYFPMVYAALPWILYGVLVGCERRRARGIAIVAAAIVFAGGTGANPALFGVALVVVVIGAALGLAGGSPLRRVLLVAGSGMALGLACCAWWIMPLATSVGVGLEAVSSAGVPDWAQWMSQRSSFLNLFKLDGYTGAETMPFADWYASGLGSLLGYLPLAIGLAGLGAVRRRQSALALGAFTLAAFLSKGVHEPLGWAYRALLAYVPGFSIFRSPYVKWIALEAMLLALVFALGLAGVTEWLRARNTPRLNLSRIGLGVALVAVVAFPWPAFAGRMLFADTGQIGFLATMPRAYTDIAAILRRDARGSRTVVLNAGGMPYPLYDWHYFGQDPLEVAAPSPVTQIDSVIPNAAQMSADALARALPSLGIGFVAVHHDVRNPTFSPQANVLLAGGIATLVYRSSALDLYRVNGGPAPLARMLHAPLLGIPRHPAVADDRVSGGELNGRLDPDAGLLVSDGGPLEILAPARAAKGVVAQVSPLLGSAIDVTDDPRGAGARDRLTFVRGNPLAVVQNTRPCRADPRGLSIESPSSWRIGSLDFGSTRTRLCLNGPQSGPLRINGADIDPSARQVALVNGMPIGLRVPLAGAVAGEAQRLLRPGFPFRFTVPRRTRAVSFILTRATRSATCGASLRTLNDRLPLGQSAFPSIDGVVTAYFSTPPKPEGQLLYVKCDDPRAFISLQSVRRLPFSLGPERPQKAQIALAQSLLRSVPLRAHELLGRARETVAAPLPLASPLVGTPHLNWQPADPELRTWSATGGRVRLSSAGPPTEMDVRGTLLAGDRYVIRFNYVASGYAELWTKIDGEVADDVSHLTADGSRHRFEARLFPPPASSGDLIMRLRSSGGTVTIDGVTLRAEGPNGAILAARPGPRVAGKVVSQERPFPWLFDVQVDGCSPCVLSVAVSDPLHWAVRGGKVVQAFTAAGAPNSAWSAIATGAATWLVDAGFGTHTIRLLYIPALIALAGLIVALIAAAIVFVLFVRRAERVRRAGASAAIGSPAALGVWLGCWALLAALLGSAWAVPGEVTADAVWLGLFPLAGVLWFGQPARRRH